MRTLKIVLVLSCVLSTAYFILGVLPIDLPFPRNWGYSNIHSRLAVTKSLLATLFCGAALCGIHKRTVMAWRLGWVYLGAAYILSVFQGLSLTRTVPQADDPWFAFASVVIGGALVLLYWGLWWKRQRGYFKATLE